MVWDQVVLKSLAQCLCGQLAILRTIKVKLSGLLDHICSIKSLICSSSVAENSWFISPAHYVSFTIQNMGGVMLIKEEAGSELSVYSISLAWTPCPSQNLSLRFAQELFCKGQSLPVMMLSQRLKDLFTNPFPRYAILLFTTSLVHQMALPFAGSKMQASRT